jgi:aryl-alcohol dehydrogenase-like predicted oxidoreductase
MDLLVAQGKVIYVGSSNFAGWHIAAAVEAARHRGSVGLVSEQSLYNLTARTVELEVLPACEAYGVGVLPWSPLGGGLLGGGLQTATEGRRADERVQSRSQSRADQLEGFEKLCAELGHEPAQVALAWLLANPVVTAPIVGPRTEEQFTGCLGALDVALSSDALAALNALFPGPGGAAPEAYAW